VGRFAKVLHAAYAIQSFCCGPLEEPELATLRGPCEAAGGEESIHVANANLVPRSCPRDAPQLLDAPAGESKEMPVCHQLAILILGKQPTDARRETAAFLGEGHQQFSLNALACSSPSRFTLKISPHFRHFTSDCSVNP